MIRVYRSTARFHDMESGRLDVLQGSLPHEAPMERELARRLQATNQWLIGVLILFLLLSFHPAAVLICIVGVFLLASICLTMAARAVPERILSGRWLHMVSPRNGPAVHGWWNSAGLGSQLNLHNLRLSLINRDFNENDYDMLLALDEEQGQRRPAPIRDSDLTAIPAWKYQASSSPSSEQGSSSDSFATKDTAEVCSVCLEAFSNGQNVRTLPCCHHFHDGCILPWLKQQGLTTTCPVCKVPVFGERNN